MKCPTWDEFAEEDSSPTVLFALPSVLQFSAPPWAELARNTMISM
jgi:hypothetical protein